MTTLTAQPPRPIVVAEPPLLLDPRHWLAALAILFVFFAPYQTLVQTVITDDAVRLGIEADDYEMTWVTVAYGIGVIYGVFAGLTLAMRIGARYTLVIAMLVFSAGNIFCGAATGLVSLAFGRFVEGFGKMLAMAICRATLYKQFDRALLVAIGFYGVFAYSTRHITPLINAYLDVWLSWRWMYWAYVPVGLIAAALVWLFIRPDRPPRRWPRADRLAGRDGVRGLDRGDRVRIRLVPQAGRVAVERVRRDGGRLRDLAHAAGRLGWGSGYSPDEHLNRIFALTRLRTLSDHARIDAPASGSRALDRRPLLHRAARLPADHGGLAHGSDLPHDGDDDFSHHAVPTAMAAPRVADRGNGRIGRLRIVALVDR